MDPQQLDVIVRVAGATLLLTTAASGVRRGLSGARAWFVPFALCLCGFLAGNTPDSDLRLAGPLGSLAVVLAGYAAVFLWWFSLAVFDGGFRPRGPVLAVGLAWIVVASADRGLFGEGLAEAGLSRVLLALGLLMVGHLVWRVLRDLEGDLLERRRGMRRAVVAALAGQLLADIAVDLFLGFEWSSQAFTVAQNAAVLAFTGWLLSLAPRPEPKLDVGRPALCGAAPADPAMGRLRTLIERERLQLDPELTFGRFVAAMGASERTVRRLINHELGHEHFRAFLNVHRVEEAKRLLRDPTRRGDKLIGVALDSGFNSLPSFNRAFKDLEGRTPSAYRAAALAEAGDGAQRAPRPPKPCSEDRSAVF